MKELKFLQKLFFLLVMGFSLSSVCACGDDEEDEPFTEESGGNGSTDNSNNGDATIPNDNIPSIGGEELPQDSIPNDSVSGSDEQLVPADSIAVQGHVAVDLGLPSGLKWATCNVGASSPEEYGGYYAWGETEEKSDYDWNTYKWCKESGNSMTKYCTDNSYATVDNKTALEPSDDVAHVKWGSNWRMPTMDEINELRNNCTWELTSQNGVNGMLVTGSNGNRIFLPAAGGRNGTDFYGRGSLGYYWSATLYAYYSNSACRLILYEDGDNSWHGDHRCCGYSVRPVTDGLLSDSEK